MNIFIVGPVHKEYDFLKQNKKHYFLESQGQQSWVEALERLGHKVFVFRYTDSILVPQKIRLNLFSIFQKISPLWKARYDKFRDGYYFFSIENYLKNKKLIFLSQKVNPQVLILSGGANFIFSSTVYKIKNLFNCKVLLFSGVNPNKSATKSEIELLNKGLIDIVIENDLGYAKLWKKFGAKNVTVLPISSTDSKRHIKIKLSDKEQKNFGCDVCFVGTLTKDRQKKLVSLVNFNLKIWGDIPPLVHLNQKLKPFYQGVAYGEKMIKIFNASKIALNFQPKDMEKGGNMRTFEIPGSGAFQLVDKVDENFFTDGRDIVLFNNLKELKEKITYYLKNTEERLKIANAGFIKAHKVHTYEEHFKKLLS